jgi:hypothetical protein
MTRGEQMAPPLNYVPLPANLVDRVLREIDEIQF